MRGRNEAASDRARQRDWAQCHEPPHAPPDRPRSGAPRAARHRQARPQEGPQARLEVAMLGMSLGSRVRRHCPRHQRRYDARSHVAPAPVRPRPGRARRPASSLGCQAHGRLGARPLHSAHRPSWSTSRARCLQRAPHWRPRISASGGPLGGVRGGRRCPVHWDFEIGCPPDGSMH